MTKQTNHRPMQLLMTTDTIGGVWTYSVELSKALQRFNVHIHLVTMGAAMQQSQREEVAELENVTVYETEFLLEWMEAPWKSVDAGGKWLLNLATAIRPEIVHLNSFAFGSLAWKVPVVMVAHSDVFSWWFAVKKTYPPPVWNEYLRRVYKGLQHADFLVAPSHTMLQETLRIFNVVAPGKVIYNARNNKLFCPAAKKPIVFSCGRLWDEAKNIPLLIKAAERIHYPVRIAGDTRFDVDNDLPGATNVTQLGRLSPAAIAAEMSTVAVYALPARYEPFGLSVLEAALSGCALVLGNISSLKEIWGNNALYIDTDNATELAETVNRLLADENLCQAYAIKAMKRARYFNPTTMAASYMSVYKKLVAPKYDLLINENISR